MIVKFAKTSSKQNAESFSKNTANQGTIIFAANSDENIGEIWVDGKKYGGGTGSGSGDYVEPTIKAEDGSTSGITIGALQEETDITGKTALDLWKAALYPEYAPKLDNASITVTPKDALSAKIVVDGSNNLMELGNEIPETTDFLYNPVGPALNGKKEQTGVDGNKALVANRAIPESISYTSKITTNTTGKVTQAVNGTATQTKKTNTKGQYTVTAETTWTQGSIPVRSYKGNNCNVYANNEKTLVSKATTSNLITKNTNNVYVIAESSKASSFVKNATYTIKFTGKIYQASSFTTGNSNVGNNFSHCDWKQIKKGNADLFTSIDGDSFVLNGSDSTQVGVGNEFNYIAVPKGVGLKLEALGMDLKTYNLNVAITKVTDNGTLKMRGANNVELEYDVYKVAEPRTESENMKLTLTL